MVFEVDSRVQVSSEEPHPSPHPGRPGDNTPPCFTARGSSSPSGMGRFGKLGFPTTTFEPSCLSRWESVRRGHEIPWDAAATPIPPNPWGRGGGLGVAMGTILARGGTSGRYPAPYSAESESWGSLTVPACPTEDSWEGAPHP